MQRNEGFTLTELLVAMAIASIVMASIYSTYMSQQRSYEITEEVTAVQQNLRAAMYYVEREVRMAGYDPLETAGATFHDVTQNPQRPAPGTAFEFSWDGAASGTTPDGLPVTAGEHIYYARDINEDTFCRKIGAGTYQAIAEHITGVTFLCYDQDGNATTTGNDVRSVLIRLSASQGGHSRILESMVCCRNMGL
jgi:prepilin-type N-terminal cleavage/methylation domain-containing protein